MGYDVSNMFLEQFGIKLNGAYYPKTGSAAADDPDGNYQTNTGNGAADDPKGAYKNLRVIEDLEEAKRMSHLGTPILFPITFAGGTYKRFSRTGKIEETILGDFLLPATCVADFSRPKTIATTRVSGGYGTVKEVFAFDDWQINIKGFFLPDPNQPQGLTDPYAQEKEMNRWNDLVCGIDIECALFQDRDINTITISDFKVSGERARPNYRPFTISATSDEALELMLVNE